ncbi:PTS fructose transporter subunit IIB [Pectinatus frisingensis]|uniref:PTS fructose transporter subunit IIB n=1 Tax=Pectinatus frisingensis TaxID=865 RepID=UPI0018C49073|nr:fructose PTS transporter subunit IIB [Pectinatus frisingensis]
MNIVGVAACVAGVAHTYIAKEKLIKAAQKAGHTISMETQGQIGIEDELSSEKIKNADVVILAVDTAIKGRDRFTGKKVVEIPTEVAVHSSGKLIKHIEENLKL